MNDVMIVDDVAVLAAALRRPTAPQSQQMRGAEEAVESAVVEVNSDGGRSAAKERYKRPVTGKRHST